MHRNLVRQVALLLCLLGIEHGRATAQTVIPDAPTANLAPQTLSRTDGATAIKPVMINGMQATSDGAIKTFPLRGIKDSPPYLHDGRLLTLDDTVEFFNLVLGTKLAPQEKQDLVLFLRAL